jgi:hypothetical protein
LIPWNGATEVEQPTRAVDSESVWFAELIWKIRAALDRTLPANTWLRISIGVFYAWIVVAATAYTSPMIGSQTSRSGNTLRINHAHGHLLAAALQSFIVTGLLLVLGVIIYAVVSSGDS